MEGQVEGWVDGGMDKLGMEVFEVGEANCFVTVSQYAELQQWLNWASIHPSTRALEWTPVFPAQSWTSWSTPERRAQPLQHRSQCDASGRPEPICRAKTEPLNNGSMSWQQSDKVPLFCTRGFSFSWCTWLWSIILSRLHVLLPSAAAADVS